MKTYTTNRKGILHRLMSFLGTMLTDAFMVPAVAVCQSSPAPVNLGTAGNFVILAKTGVSPLEPPQLLEILELVQPLRHT